MNELRFRQVHLDFHTSPLIPGIGEDFDLDAFVARLKAGHVDSVTCFSRCHHGYIYHDTRFPNRHPHLKVNLLAEQIRACHQADIRVPIYVTVGWDHLAATEHPEWIEIDENGTQVGRKPLGAGWGWYNMDFASPYLDYCIAQTQEVCDLFGDEVDGFFFDIIFQRGVHSVWGLERFRQLGWDPADPVRQREMQDLLTVECTDRLAGAVRAKNKNCTIFFNGGHVGPTFRRMIGNNSHLEIESLPSGGWGYMHFPMTSRYARTLGKDFLGMTGKFSESWGHFNSYKNRAALEYECFSMLAAGGKCSVGDQLHPRGVLDRATYELIGSVYAQVEAKESWCRGATPVTEIAVLNAEEFDKSGERMDPRNLGAARMLIEGRHQFDFVDTQADLSGYRLVILPDCIPDHAGLKAKLAQFLASGGRVIASHRSLHVLPEPPAEVVGDLPHSPDFLRADSRLHQDAETDFVMYERGLEVRPLPGAEVMATISYPYFSRTWDHFISHAHSPVEKNTDVPGVIRQGNVVYFAHPIFTTYAKHSMSFHRDVVLAALKELLRDPVLRVDGPTSLQATVTQQGSNQIVHLLHYIPERRALNFDVVEDALPVLGLTVELRGEWSRAKLVPEGRDLEVTQINGYCRVHVDRLVGHQMIEFEG